MTTCLVPGNAMKGTQNILGNFQGAQTLPADFQENRKEKKKFNQIGNVE